MIDDQKLLCAFILGAYSSDSCGHHIPKPIKEANRSLMKKYISGGSYFPENEINSFHPKIRDGIINSDIRDYIYLGHLNVVREKIIETADMDFKKAMQTEPFVGVARNCAVNFFKTTEVDGDRIIVESLSGKTLNGLLLEPGLELPEKGDLVSGHWRYFLEILNDDLLIQTYTEARKQFFGG